MFNYNKNTVKSFSLNNESVFLFQKYIWARHKFKFLFTCSTEDSHAINTMDSSKEKTLCLVSWNICGQQKPNIDNFSKERKADIFFLQETRIGPESDMPLEKLDGWRCFFTVYDSNSKGVAILIKDCVPFQYLGHDEDYSGGYLVLFCHLHGELFTLVNVYNHKDDKEMLKRLQEYLREAAEGVLVVGGDFNTVLDLSWDRISKAETVPHTSQWGPFKKFTASLNLMDTWAYFHPTVKAFTYCQNYRYSRLDMFLLCEDNLERIKDVDIHEAKRTVDQKKRGKETDSDHLLLLICLTVNEVPNAASQLEQFYEPDKRAGKINGAEILSVIKSLTDSGHKGPNGISVQTCKNFCLLYTEIFKTCFNCLMKSNKLPQDFNASISASRGRKHFNVDYLIFTMILAKRLNLLLEAFPEKRSQTNICDWRYCVTFAEKTEKTEKIKWTFLESSLSDLLKMYIKSVEKTPNESPNQSQKESQKESQNESHQTKMINILLKGIVPLETEENNILEVIIPKAQDGFRELQEGCPLTRPILNMVLKYLELDINKKYEKYKTNVCYARQVVVIHEKSYPDLRCLCEEFKRNSGIELKCFQL